MSRKTFLVIILFIVIFIPPMRLISNWYLSSYSDGRIYFLLNFIYPPDDYQRTLKVVEFDSKGEVSFGDINHNYQGWHMIYVAGPMVKNKYLEFEVSIICRTGEIFTFSQNDLMGVTDWGRNNSYELRIGRYMVNDGNINGFKSCSAQLVTEDFDNSIYLRFVKMPHY